MTTPNDNAAAQRELYGAPLGDLCHEVMDAFGFTQSRLAQVLGISAPMLSQLMGARRVKIGNPAAVHRLQRLLDLVPNAANMSADEAASVIAEISEQTATLSTTRAGDTIGPLLRAIASPDDLLAAARAVPGTPLAAALEGAATGA